MNQVLLSSLVVETLNAQVTKKWLRAVFKDISPKGENSLFLFFFLPLGHNKVFAPSRGNKSKFYINDSKI